MSAVKITLYYEELEIDFDYQPPEPKTWNYPGCPEELIINSINGIDPELFKPPVIEQIKDRIFENS